MCKKVCKSSHETLHTYLMEKSGTFFIHKTQSMDFHPIVVHLPIGLLIGYGVIEIVQAIPKIKRYNLFQTKIILVISGTL